MKIGIIGSGVVGQTLGAKLVDRGEDIALGTRSPGNLGDKRGFGKPLDEWLTSTGSRARIATFDSTPSLAEFYKRLMSGALNIATADGQWWFGLALVKEGFLDGFGVA